MGRAVFERVTKAVANGGRCWHASCVGTGRHASTDSTGKVWRRLSGGPLNMARAVGPVPRCM